MRSLSQVPPHGGRILHIEDFNVDLMPSCYNGPYFADTNRAAAHADRMRFLYKAWNSFAFDLIEPLVDGAPPYDDITPLEYSLQQAAFWWAVR